jgi:hypothetical protein
VHLQLLLLAALPTAAVGVPLSAPAMVLPLRKTHAGGAICLSPSTLHSTYALPPAALPLAPTTRGAFPVWQDTLHLPAHTPDLLLPLAAVHVLPLAVLPAAPLPPLPLRLVQQLRPPPPGQPNALLPLQPLQAAQWRPRPLAVHVLLWLHAVPRPLAAPRRLLSYLPLQCVPVA